MTRIHQTTLTTAYVLGVVASAIVLAWAMPIAVRALDAFAFIGFLLILPAFTVIGAAALALRRQTASTAFKYLSAGAGLWSVLVYLMMNSL